MQSAKKTGPAAAPKQLVIASDIVDKNDSRLLKQLDSLTAAGYAVELVAMRDIGTSSPRATVVTCRSQTALIRGLAMAAEAIVVFFSFFLGPRNLPVGSIKRWVEYKARCAAFVYYLSIKNVDLLLISGPELLSPSIKVKKKIGTKIIYDAHEFYEDEDVSEPDRGVWVKRVETAAEGFLDGFITVNEGIAKLYRETHPAFPAPVIVHNSALSFKLEYDGRLHAAANLPAHARIVLYQGGLTPMRGLEKLVDAAAMFSEDWQLVILGNGRMEQALRQRAPRGRVTFISAVPSDELLKWTCGASLGAMLYEGVTPNQIYCTPNKLWEYPAAGVPILSSDLPEIKRLIGPYKAAFFLPDGSDARDIARKVNAISPSDLNTARLGCAAFTSANSWIQSSEALVETVQTTLAPSTINS